MGNQYILKLASQQRTINAAHITTQSYLIFLPGPCFTGFFDNVQAHALLLNSPLKINKNTCIHLAIFMPQGKMEIYNLNYTVEA